MKFSIASHLLFKELNFVQGIVERVSTIPILANILIESVGNLGMAIKITGTDLDTTVSTIVPASVTEPGFICVPARKLLEIAKLLPDADAFFVTEPNSFQAHIKCNRANFKLAGEKRESFPETPRAPSATTHLPADVLIRFIKHTSFAITNEQSRFTLSGAKFELDGNLARMVTTDGHRLAFIETTLNESAGIKTDALIPRKALAELNKLCAADTASAIGFSEDANHLYFQTATKLLATRKMTGTFPNYETVIPKDSDKTVNFDAGELLAAINRVSQMADERTHGVCLTVRRNEILISAQSSEEGEAHETVAAEYRGEEITLKFQHQYVKDFINAIKDDDVNKVSMSFRDSSAQTLFRPANENGDFLVVIMPLR